ncbi:MAG: ASKHA domain-containing protein [Bacteroidales bacterium]
MKTFIVKLVPIGKEIRVKEGTPLLDVLNEYGVEFPCGGNGSCGQCKIKLLEGTIPTDPVHLKRLAELKLDRTWRLACLSECHSDLSLEIGQFETIIQADQTSFDFKPGVGLGVAFDLGTTTLVGQLIDLSTGKIMAVETAMNPQGKFGSDLITRLEWAIRNGSGEMTRLIRQKVGEMVKKMMVGHGNTLDRMVMVGNTVMHHLFCGYDITSLSYYPFETPHLGMKEFSSGELGWKHLNCRTLLFYPSIGSFVGSDILAGIMATGMHLKESCSVLIDLGTNGEIVVGNSKRLLCASTAAGPAFEGAKISQGMQATSGAISSIDAEQEKWKCHVIGNTRSRGICGSGLIDAIQLFISRGLVGSFGEIISGETEIALDAQVSLTQKDIQEFQLAKAAIATGITILLRKMGIGRLEAAHIFIAGGFGTYINLGNVTRLGMLDFPEERMHKMGNSALLGGKMFLFEDPDFADTILRIVRHVSLEAEPDFQDIFVNELIFPE